jgi:hypothetical protein
MSHYLYPKSFYDNRVYYPMKDISFTIEIPIDEQIKAAENRVNEEKKKLTELKKKKATDPKYIKERLIDFAKTEMKKKGKVDDAKAAELANLLYSKVSINCDQSLSREPITQEFIRETIRILYKP